MNKTISKYIAISLVIFSIVTSCSKQDEEYNITQQESMIDNFVKANSTKRVVVNNKASRIVLTEGVGESAAEGDSIFIEYAGYIFNGSKGNIFDTNVKTIAKQFELDTTIRNFNQLKYAIGSDDLIPGLKNGLYGAKKGEQCYIVFSSESGFGKKPISNIPKLTPLIFEIWIKDLKKN